MLVGWGEARPSPGRGLRREDHQQQAGTRQPGEEPLSRVGQRFSVSLPLRVSSFPSFLAARLTVSSAYMIL